MIQRSDSWWIDKFKSIYDKEPKAMEMEQFKRSYYVADWGRPGDKQEYQEKKIINDPPLS